MLPPHQLLPHPTNEGGCENGKPLLPTKILIHDEDFNGLHGQYLPLAHGAGRGQTGGAQRWAFA